MERNRAFVSLRQAEKHALQNDSDRGSSPYCLGKDVTSIRRVYRNDWRVRPRGISHRGLLLPRPVYAKPLELQGLLTSRAEDLNVITAEPSRLSFKKLPCTMRRLITKDKKVDVLPGCEIPSIPCLSHRQHG